MFHYLKHIIFKVLFIAIFALTLGACAGGDGMNGFFTGSLSEANSIKAPLTRAQKNFEDGNFGLAEQQYRKLLQDEEDNLEAWIGLAATYDQLGRYDLSEKAYNRALKIGGRRPEILNNLGYSHIMQGNNEKARHILLEALSKDSNNPHIRGNIALLDTKNNQ